MTVARLLAGAALAAALIPSASVAAVSTGAPAALLVFPLILVNEASPDSLIQLTNTDDADVAVRCLYENRGGSPPFTPFQIRLKANQPVAWSARRGLTTVPGSSSSIPALDPGPFTGLLRCLTVDDAGEPSDRNVLVGSATILSADGPPVSAIDSSLYNATGFDALPGAPNADDELMLGGPAAEYAACPAEIVLQSFFDGAILELGADGSLQREVSTDLVLITCTLNPFEGADATVDFRLTNEFGEMFTTAHTLREQLIVGLSNIDTVNPSQSIFNIAIQGSPAGTIRIAPRGGGSGVLALAMVAHADPISGGRRHHAAVSPQLVGELATANVVDLQVPTPIPSCVGDCDGSGDVAINELITGVNIALDNQPLSACPAFDADHSDSVAINELIAAVNNALGSCQ